MVQHDRVWARGQTVTDPTHVAAAQVLREQYLHPVASRPEPDDPLVRDLADYDRAFGLTHGNDEDVA